MALFFDLLQVSLGNRDSLSRVPSQQEWNHIYNLSKEQAVLGIMQRRLECLPKEQLPPKPLLIEWIGTSINLQRNNLAINDAIISLCSELNATGIRYLVVKGQTLDPIYPQPSIRQNGDIDYLVHPEDWGLAIDNLNQKVINGEIDGYESNNALKHIEWAIGEMDYEMHRSLASFSCIKHQRYWESVLMPEIWDNPWTVSLGGNLIPTLAPRYNVIYLFVHIFEHFIKEGIGVRHFIDWYYILNRIEWGNEERDLLERHLRGIGLFNAFCGMGAVLTDYLGLDSDRFPFTIDDKAHNKAQAIIENIMRLGNLGHNKVYRKEKGPVHGIERVMFMFNQSLRFGYLAPAEAWGAIPHIFKWWGRKVSNKVRQ